VSAKKLVASAGSRWPRSSRPLTPNYASPEQLRGQPVSTATDVYSLGVLLYQLLTGRLPRLFRALTPPEIESALAREAPPPQVDRDLDAIVLKALAVEPARRYASVEQLAADLRRWTEGRPILARPHTLRYRAAKFLRRHLVAATAAAGVAAMLLGFTLDKARQAQRIAHERDRAHLEADKARELASFLADLLRSSDPWQAAGREVTVREVLDRGAEEIRRLDAGPELRGMLLDAMGTIYLELARFDEARPLLEEALAERRRALPADHPEVAASLHHLGLLSQRTGRYDEAETFYRQAVAIRRARAQPLPLAESLHGLGQTLYGQGAYGEAEDAHREACGAWSRAGRATFLCTTCRSRSSSPRSCRRPCCRRPRRSRCERSATPGSGPPPAASPPWTARVGAQHSAPAVPTPRAGSRFPPRPARPSTSACWPPARRSRPAARPRRRSPSPPPRDLAASAVSWCATAKAVPPSAWSSTPARPISGRSAAPATTEACAFHRLPRPAT
jgi:tetratricopeptide (TPR) repeat protein